MRARTAMAVAAAAVLATAACRQAGPWFSGSFEEALRRAEADRTLVMVEFFTDW